MGAKERASFTQVHTSADSMGDNGDNREKHFVTNGIVKVVDFGTTCSSRIALDKDILDGPLGVNKFQVLRELMENYPCLDCDLFFGDQAVYPSVVPKSPF